MQKTPEDPSQAPAAPEDPAGRRACDQCRLRKIRCDKDWPCSNCRVAKRSCTSTGTGHRAKEPRQRVLISSQYERKIDQIESRLGGIENLLQTLVSNNHLSATDATRMSQTPQTGSSSGIPTTVSNADFDSSDNESGYGGDSGLAAQTAFASDFLEHAVQRTSLRDVSPTIEAALSNLHQLVDMQTHRSISHGPRFPLQQPIPSGGLSKLPLPPMESVVQLLRRLKAAPPSMFSFNCSIVGITDISHLCRMVYFPTEDFSHATFIIVNSLIYNLFIEYASQVEEGNQSQTQEYIAYARLAQSNLETTLANLPLFLSPKTENVQALVLGILYAIDVSRPSVAWHLCSTAAQLCQTGGFHRIECIRLDPPKLAQLKNILFWQVYTLDKGLGLRIGRTSVIRDHDINIPRAFNFEGFAHLEDSTIPQLWLKTAEIQGEIYDDLYSPAALARPSLETMQRAQALAAKCRAHEKETEKTRPETLAYLQSLKASSILDVFLKGDEVQFNVTLTLVYRAIPAPPGSISKFSTECLEAARKAIVAHQECIEMFKFGTYMQSIYAHWNLMLTPFAPFFIMFCYIIETSSQEHLQLLKDFVASIKALRHVSETIEKLYRLFQVMLEVAMVYVEAKSQQQEDQTMIPIGDEFDMYLSQLGLVHPDGLSMDPTADNAGRLRQGQPAQAGDWFLGNRNMFGLLEEDLSNIDPSGWMQNDSM